MLNKKFNKFLGLTRSIIFPVHFKSEERIVCGETCKKWLPNSEMTSMILTVYLEYVQFIPFFFLYKVWISSPNICFTSRFAFAKKAMESEYHWCSLDHQTGKFSFAFLFYFQYKYLIDLYLPACICKRNRNSSHSRMESITTKQTFGRSFALRFFFLLWNYFFMILSQ